jgi:4-oxalocrotonate tautomerase
MDKRLSRRGFMKKGAVALGAVAACDVTAIVGAASGDAFKVSALKGLKENNMPHVIVKLWPGKSEQQKKRLAEAIAEDVVSILELGEESVSVSIEEIEPQDWTEKVYKPDILNKPKTLYKKPGYNPLK